MPDPDEEPEITTDAAEPNENVGRLTAPAGLDVRAAVRATVPVKPPLGVTVMVAELPVVAPDFKVMGPLFESVNPGGGT